MPSPRKATKQPAKRKVPDLNQEVADAFGATLRTEVPKPKAQKSKQERGPRPKK
jgi:hypothetical protein